MKVSWQGFQLMDYDNPKRIQGTVYVTPGETKQILQVNPIRMPWKNPLGHPMIYLTMFVG